MEFFEGTLGYIEAFFLGTLDVFWGTEVLKSTLGYFGILYGILRLFGGTLEVLWVTLRLLCRFFWGTFGYFGILCGYFWGTVEYFGVL